MGETKQSTKKSTEKSEEKAGESKFKDRKNADLGLFKIYYPESWQYDEEHMQKEAGIRR